MRITPGWSTGLHEAVYRCRRLLTGWIIKGDVNRKKACSDSRRPLEDGVGENRLWATLTSEI